MVFEIAYQKEELEKVGLHEEQEARRQYAERQAEKYERLAKYSLDPENQKEYGTKAKQWKHARKRTGGQNTKEYAESKRPLVNFKAVPQNQVVEVLRKDSEEWVNNLSYVEKHAIKKYTYNSGDKKPNRFFEKINAMLRGDLPEDKKLRNYSEVISNTLKKNKLKHDLICYRNMEFNPYNAFNWRKFYRGTIYKHVCSLESSIEQTF